MKEICIQCWWIFLLVSSQTSQEHIVTHAQDHNTALVHGSSFSFVFVLCLDWWDSSLPVGCLKAILKILLNFTHYYVKHNNMTQHYLNTSIAFSNRRCNMLHLSESNHTLLPKTHFHSASCDISWTWGCRANGLSLPIHWILGSPNFAS